MKHSWGCDRALVQVEGESLDAAVGLTLATAVLISSRENRPGLGKGFCVA